MRRDRYRDTGFTLIELLVAVAIFATIATVLYSSFRAGVISFRRVSAEGKNQQKARYLFDAMTKDFKNMVYVANLALEGAQEKVSFVSISTLSDKAADNAQRVSYYLSSGSDKEGERGSARTLIRKSQLLLDAVSLQQEEELGQQGEGEQLPAKKQGGAEEQKKGAVEEKLADNVSMLKLTYLKAEKGQDPSGEIEYEWVDVWDYKDCLPVGIKIELALEGIEGGSAVLSRRIWIPQGKPVVQKAVSGQAQGE
jgi:prepilin-type N-terminal cleavage/methylation domain-containing protein